MSLDFGCAWTGACEVARMVAKMAGSVTWRKPEHEERTDSKGDRLTTNRSREESPRFVPAPPGQTLAISPRTVSYGTASGCVCGAQRSGNLMAPPRALAVAVTLPRTGLLGRATQPGFKRVLLRMGG